MSRLLAEIWCGGFEVSGGFDRGFFSYSTRVVVERGGFNQGRGLLGSRMVVERCYSIVELKRRARIGVEEALGGGVVRCGEEEGERLRFFCERVLCLQLRFCCHGGRLKMINMVKHGRALGGF